MRIFTWLFLISLAILILRNVFTNPLTPFNITCYILTVIAYYFIFA